MAFSNDMTAMQLFLDRKQAWVNYLELIDFLIGLSIKS